MELLREFWRGVFRICGDVVCGERAPDFRVASLAPIFISRLCVHVR